MSESKKKLLAIQALDDYLEALKMQYPVALGLNVPPAVDPLTQGTEREEMSDGTNDPRAEQTKKLMQSESMKEALKQLEKLGGKHFAQDELIFKGDQFTIPESMTLLDARRFLKAKYEELEKNTTFQQSYKFRPHDVAYCTANALQRKFGSFVQKDKIEMFFGMEVRTPPELVTVSISHNETVQVPWGAFVLPFLPDVTFTLTDQNTTEGPVGMLFAEGPKKRRHAVQGVFNAVKEELETNSLYRGKAFDGQVLPNFLDLSGVDPAKIIFAAETLQQLEASLWGPIEHTEAMSSMGVPFKRAILLHGDFGTGKTLALNETGRRSTLHDITFILARPGRDNLAQTMATARMYQPCIIAFEDVDIVADVEEDAKRISTMLDMFDGIEAKNSKVMLVLTTNHIEKLHKGMLRPGRLDAIIPIGPPDAAGIVRLIEVNMPTGTLDESIDWGLVAQAMEGFLPAFVVEAAQRAIRYAVVRTQGRLDAIKITSDDLVQSAEGLRPQYEYMQQAKTENTRYTLDDHIMDVFADAAEDDQSPLHRFAPVLGRAIGKNLTVPERT